MVTRARGLHTIHYGGTQCLTLYFFIYRRRAARDPGNRRTRALPLFSPQPRKLPAPRKPKAKNHSPTCREFSSSRTSTGLSWRMITWNRSLRDSRRSCANAGNVNKNDVYAEHHTDSTHTIVGWKDSKRQMVSVGKTKKNRTT